jgi:protein involved in polysaccharide export with SLBB domain
MFPQGKGGFTGLEPDIMMQQQLKNNLKNSDLSSQSKFPVSNTVDPAHYYLGPGDILSLQILPMIFSEGEIIVVSPDNSIVIPRIGQFKVKDLTLQQLSDTLQAYIYKEVPKSKVNLSLIQSRTVLVTIRGNVLFPGQYYLPASYNVSSAVSFSNQNRSEADMSAKQYEAFMKLKMAESELAKYYTGSGLNSPDQLSARFVNVIHSDGTYSIADLARSIVEQNNGYNPYIREGDLITVPYSNNVSGKISINGAVVNPYTTMFNAGDKASFLLKLGLGLLQEADTNNIYLVNPASGEKTILQCDQSMNLISQDYNLEPGSIIIVGSKTSQVYSKYGVVSVKGNVNKPGSYPIEVGKTRIKDVIENADGLNQEAYLPLANIVRSELADLSAYNAYYEISRLFQYSDLVLEDTIRYMIDINYRKPIVSCDFVKLFGDTSSTDNVLLEDGDLINIPSNPRKVYVFGQVNQPGYVEFSMGQNMEWYISHAGGYAQNAEVERARIIRGKTFVWEEGTEDVPVYAGDMIYVPRPPDIPKAVELQNYSILASVLLATVSIVSIILNILNN